MTKNLRRTSVRLYSMIVLFCYLFSSNLFAQKAEDLQNTVTDRFQFNGYTNYWHDSYDKWIRYGNLFKMTVPDIAAAIAQSKVDVAEDMSVPGLSMEEGFMNGLIKESFTLLDQPSVNQIEQAVQKGNLLILLDPGSEAGKKVAGKFPGSGINNDSHQLGAKDLVKVNAFVLQKDKKKIFVILSNVSDYRAKIKQLVDNTLQVVKDYDLHRGWFGAALSRADTSYSARRLDIIAKGMNEGNDWFVFSGLKEVPAKKELADWMSMINLPVVTEVGSSPVYGCKDYEGIQSISGDSAFIKYAHEHGGYVFHQVADTSGLRYDGFMAGEGNKKQIDNEEVPFISYTGGQVTGRQAFNNRENEVVPTMILFVKKGEKFTRESLWQSILSRKEVAVVGQGKLMGPAFFRNALNMLALDREFLENYFGDRINMEALLEGKELKVRLTNTYAHPVSGTLQVNLPADLKINGSQSSKVELPANSTKTVTYQVMTSSNGQSKVNPVAIHYDWGSSKKSTIATLDLTSF